MPTDPDENQDVFRECLSGVLIKSLTNPTKPPKKRAAKGRKNAIKPGEQSSSAADESGENDAEELGEFIEVLIIAPSLPKSLI